MRAVCRRSYEILVENLFLERGYSVDEAVAVARVAGEAALHGIHSHSAAKALKHHERFSHTVRPGATCSVRMTSPTSEHWNAHLQPGPFTAWAATERAVELARCLGVGLVTVENCSHYLWGGAYALRAASRGTVFFSTCTATLAEVAPYGGRRAAMGTNPHTWALPTESQIGYNLLVDWATSVLSMSGAQSASKLPRDVALDARGLPTTDPAEVAALLPFGAHKGHGLCFMTEVLAAFMGGGLPSKRGLSDSTRPGACALFLALNQKSMETRPSRILENVRACVLDILEGNPNAMPPGLKEHQAAVASRQAGGLLIPDEELEFLDAEAEKTKAPRLKRK